MLEIRKKDRSKVFGRSSNMRRRLFFVLAIGALASTMFGLAAEAQERPRVAVLEFENKAGNQWWYSHGGEAAQDIFVTELVKSGRYRVVERAQLQALLAEQNLSLAGDVDAASAVQAGRLLGVKYFITGALTEYGSTDSGASSGGIGGLPSFGVGKKKFTAAFNARAIDTETGEIVWADEGRGEESNFRVRVRGTGGGVDQDSSMFDKVLKPIVQELAASLARASL
jgi:curli biogenesis system outer membrane secretion channel CsgG